MTKRRILFIGEASFLATGFSTYWAEVIKRLHATGEFEIAEMGSYSHDGDPRIAAVPWKFYPVGPAATDAEGQQQYASRPANQFGEWRFNQVLLDFRPDIVCGIRDWWMDEFVLRSPFREHFTFVWMPTIDGAPQRDPWLDSYRDTDYVMTYSEYGRDVLLREGGKDVNFVTVASPGAEIDVFRPAQDKNQHKVSHGIDPNCLIVGTVMRNQKRKLYVDLIEAFSEWVQKTKASGHVDLARRTFLYLHTSYPDVGYDLGKAIRQFQVGSKVLMTYLCSECNTAYPAFFSSEWTNCRKCGKPGAHPPNANHSVPREVLAQIYNLFDVYVQYSICEGWGMPVTEAMACGVPAMVVDYSAMEDHAKMPGGIPIKVGRYFYEAVIETEQRRALPDNAHFGQQLDKFLRMKPEDRAALSKRTHDYVMEPTEVWGQTEKLPRFSYDRTSAIWGNLLRTCKIKSAATTWLKLEPILHRPNLKMPKVSMTNTEFVRWAISEVLGRPEMAHSYTANEWIKSLNIGFHVEGGARVAATRESLIQTFLGLASQKNQAELHRVAGLKTSDPSSLLFEVI